MRPTVILAVAAVVLAIAVTLRSKDGDRSPVAVPDASSRHQPPIEAGGPPEPEPPETVAPAALEPAAPSAVDGVVRLPDGSVRPSLNGVVGAPPLSWPPGRAYAPIVEVRRFDDGLDWFVHADGTMSTTRYMFRPDLGREDATTIRFDPERNAARLQVRPGGGEIYVPAADR